MLGEPKAKCTLYTLRLYAHMSIDVLLVIRAQNRRGRVPASTG